MTGSDAAGAAGLPFDFDALYRGESPAAGVPPMTTPPWDTKEPKDNVVGWHRDGLIRGEVLDVGCGLGDNAVYLAGKGFRVTALDISPAALTTAERRAADAHVDIRFAVSDAATLAGYTGAFDTIVDSGMFHCLDEAAKRSYAAAAHRAARPGATLLLSCFREDNPPAEDGRPRPMVTEQTLRDVLGGAGWEIVSLDPVTVRREGWGGDMNFWYVRTQRLS